MSDEKTSGYSLDRDDDGMTARQRAVTGHLVDDGWTYEEIGTELGISRQRVGQIVRDLLNTHRVTKGEDGVFRRVLPAERKS